MPSKREQRNKMYASIHAEAERKDKEQLRLAMADLCRTDLFYLLTVAIGRQDIDRDWLFARCNEVQSAPDGHLDLWFREGYKQEILTNRILTIKGWSTIGDLSVGDTVYSPAGNPVDVVALGPVTTDDTIYELTFASHQGGPEAKVRAGSEHRWDVLQVFRGRGPDEWREIRRNSAWIHEYTAKAKRRRNHRWLKVPVVAPLQMPGSNLDIDPYVLGVWLGDGHCIRGRVTNGDDQLYGMIAPGACKTPGVNTYAYTIPGLTSQLRAAGLLNRTSATKFIPAEYLYASLADRIALFQGLMDTDGTVGANGQLRFHTISDRLADNFSWLAMSLGVIVSRCTGVKGMHVLSFSPTMPFAPFRLDKHLTKYRQCNSGREQYWYIKDVQVVESAPARCIQVQGGRYVTGDWLIPTHNSTIITFGKTIQDILLNPEITVGIFSHTKPIAKAFLRQIKYEFETNERLKYLFPDILYSDPKKQAANWSEDKGITVKRKTNPKEATVEAHGLVDGQPTALSVETLVLTANRGWVAHGDLTPMQDYVFGEDGKPVLVIHNTGPMTGKPCVKVKFKQTEIIAAEDHLWPINREVYPRDESGKQLAVNKKIVREIVKTTELPLSVDGSARSRRKHLPQTPAIEIQEVDLPLDPYLLGIWLGDGSTWQSMVTTAEPEVVLAFEDAGYPMEIKQRRPGCVMYCPGEKFWGEIRSLGLGRESGKFIPEQYLFSSSGQRLALLQGLIDSDGSVGKMYGGSSQANICNTNYNIVEGARFLLASLGLGPGRIMSSTNRGSNRKDCYYVFFTPVHGSNITRLGRYKRNMQPVKKHKHHYVKELVRVDSVTVNCIQVADERGVYLAGEYLVPTHNSKHYSLLVYDDVVTLESVTTPEMIEKVTNAWALSLNLGAEGGRVRYIGTRYHFNDTYKTIMDRGAAIPRIHAATDDGTPTGKPVFLSREVLAKKRRDQGPFVFACQMLQNPKADEAQGFKEEWLRFYDRDPDPSQMNLYIVVDPANEKKKKSDYTVMWVIGLAPDRNYYVFDLIRDRLNLTERTNKLFALHQEYLPEGVGYEQYGMQSDIQHIEDVQDRRHYRFNITPLGGNMSKVDRIRKLIPLFEQSRIWLPRNLYYRNYEGKKVNLIKQFITDEYIPFPVMLHDDMLDDLARIADPDLAAAFPKFKPREKKKSWRDRLRKHISGAGNRPRGAMVA